MKPPILLKPIWHNKRFNLSRALPISLHTKIVFSKAIKAQSKAPAWWQQSRELEKLLSGAWEDVSKEFMGDLRRAIETQDIAKLTELAKTVEKLGPEIGTALGDRPEAIMASVQQKAHAYWTLQGISALSLKQLAHYSKDYQGFLANVHAQQVKRFAEAFPKRILHPEITRQVELLRGAKLTRAADLVQIEKRLERIAKYPDQYWEGLSSVQVGRIWHTDGILMAEENGVKTGMISGPLDKKACPVCKKVVGTEVSIRNAAEKIRRDIGIEDPDEYVQAWPFPRKKDVDNISKKELESKGLLPPFHGRCRHGVTWLYMEDGTKIRRRRPKPPRVKADVDTREKLISERETLIKGKLKEMGYSSKHIKDAESALKRVLKNGTPTVRIDDARLQNVIKEGKFWAHNQGRRAEEKLAFGKAYGPEKAPVYGYMEPNKGKFLKMYGNARVGIKPSTMDKRGTFLFGDTLVDGVSMIEKEPFLLPSAKMKPSLTSVFTMSEGEFTNKRALQRFMKNARNINSPEDLKKFQVIRKGSYVECQFHRGLTRKDINHLTFSHGDKPTPELEALCRKHKIRIYVEDKTGKLVEHLGPKDWKKSEVVTKGKPPKEFKKQNEYFELVPQKKFKTRSEIEQWFKKTITDDVFISEDLSLKEINDTIEHLRVVTKHAPLSARQKLSKLVIGDVPKEFRDQGIDIANGCFDFDRKILWINGNTVKEAPKQTMRQRYLSRKKAIMSNAKKQLDEVKDKKRLIDALYTEEDWKEELKEAMEEFKKRKAYVKGLKPPSERYIQGGSSLSASYDKLSGGTMVHEYGHVWHYHNSEKVEKALGIKFDEIWANSEEAREITRKFAFKMDKMHKYGSYSGADPLECFAENWAAYMLGEIKDMHPEMLAFFDKAFPKLAWGKRFGLMK